MPDKVLILADVAFALGGWFYRYDVTPAAAGIGGYMINRWTGTIYVLHGATIIKVKAESGD